MKIQSLSRESQRIGIASILLLGVTGLAHTAEPVAAPVHDQGWPREITQNKIRFTLYQPQVDEWQSYRTLKVSLAVSMTSPGEPPALGVAEFTGETATDSDTRTVVVRNIKVTSARFNTEKPEDATRFEALLKQNFPSSPVTVSLDRLLAGVKISKEAAAPVEVRMDPPPIFVSTTPAMILIVDGKPVLSPAVDTGLKFVVNTNWDLFLDEASGTYYLLSGDEWLSSKDLAGSWELAPSIPSSIDKLPDDDTWKHIKDETPWSIRKGMILPKVFYSDKPAELITFQGDPVWQKVEGTKLEWAQNSDDHVFRHEPDGTIYFLVSGRWFKSPKLGETWTYAGNDLPEDFKLIPEESPCADVLASVPGTVEAEDAVILATVPVEAVVKIKEAEAKAKVAYHGDPSFKPIEGTKLEYAANTESDVILCDGEYYLCQDAVWFVSTTSNGPWTVCTDVPKAIYGIPASSPVYRVTYVNVEKDDSDDQVTCSYTAGYFGAFVAGVALEECLVWGTGYYYPPYIGWGPYPAYYPYHYSYGVAASYNPWTGGYAVGGRVYGPYASAGRAAWYNPATGRYGRAAQVSGPYGTRTVAGAYNPRTGGGWVTHQGSNGYAQWGTSAASRGGQWVQAAHINTANGGAAAWRGSEGGGRFHWSDQGTGGMAVHDGDFYAGHDGNVYRKDDGQWSKWENGGWQPAGHNADGFRPNRPEPGPGPRPDPRPRPTPDDRNGFISGQTRHQLPGVPDTTRPGAGGAGERRELPQNRLGEGGAGERRELPQNRLGEGGAGQRNPEIPHRQTTDIDEVSQRLNRDSIARDRGEQRTHEFQSQPSLRDSGGFQGGGFQRGGGGGGFSRGGGGGFQHRGGGGFHRR